MTRKIAIGLLIVALAQFLVPLLPALGLGETIGARAEKGARPPELPPGVFFSIWSAVFLTYLIFALLAVLKPTYLEKHLGPPLMLAGLGNVIWMLSAQFLGWQVLDFVLLLPILVFAWMSARRLHLMGGFDGTWRRLNASLLTGLFSGWLWRCRFQFRQPIARWRDLAPLTQSGCRSGWRF